MSRLQKMDDGSVSKVNTHCDFGKHGVHGGCLLGLTPVVDFTGAQQDFSFSSPSRHTAS